MKDVHCLEDAPFSFRINASGWMLKGWSRAGFKTGFLLYPHKWIFDAGIAARTKPTHLFLTHQHYDHVQCLPQLCTRHKSVTTNLYVAAESVPAIAQLERVVSVLGYPPAIHWSEEEVWQAHGVQCVPIRDGEVYFPDDKHQVTIIRAYHDLPSYGFGIALKEKVIKPAFAEWIQPQSDKNEEAKRIAQLKEWRSKHVELYDWVWVPQCVFFCDSSIRHLAEDVTWQQYPVVVCECTGLCKPLPPDSHHTSLVELLPVLRAHRDKRWLLIHVSVACTDAEIEEIETNLRQQEGLDVTICK